ncbi:MAG: hypothetical protein ACI8XW_002978 [Gammaproteobacteria bacterium]|jgi:hypothetical protein
MKIQQNLPYKAFNSLPAVAGIRRYAAHPLTRRYAHLRL